MCIHFRAYCMPRALELVVGGEGVGVVEGGGALMMKWWASDRFLLIWRYSHVGQHGT